MKKLVFFLILSLSFGVTNVVAQCVGNLKATISGGTNPICENTSPGTLTATASGESGSYTYLWYENGRSTGITTQTYDPGILTEYSTFYCKIYSGVCGPVSTPPILVDVALMPTATIGYAGTPFCLSQTTDQPVDVSGTNTYTGEGSFSSTDGLSINSYNGAISPSISIAGIYIVTYTTVASYGCPSIAVTTSVTINDCLIATASNNGPVCKGSPLTLSGGPDGMNSYSWIGPEGFISTEQNPTVSSSASADMAGVYTLTTTDNTGTQSTNSTTVIVKDISKARAFNNGPVCDYGYVELFGSPDNMLSYSWSGPNGFTSQQQNQGLSGVAGTYTLTIDDGCSNQTSVTTDVVVHPTKNSYVSFPTKICLGSNLELHGGPDNMASYYWSAPGFSSVEQNPIVTNPKAGSRFMFTAVDSFGCGRSTYQGFGGYYSSGLWGDVDGPVCLGSEFKLHGLCTPPGASDPQWTGPNGFNSNEWSPIVSPHATPDMAGSYYLTATDSAHGCRVTLKSPPITIYVPPVTPTIANITQPSCAQGTGSVTLTSLPATGYWYIKRSPDNVTLRGTGTSTTIANIDPGTYTFSVRVAQCPSASSDTVVISAYPGAPSIPIIGTITHPTCKVATGSVILNGLPSKGSWTITRMPDGILTNGKGTSKVITGLLPGTYSFIVDNGLGCNSAPSENVVINAQPITPAIPTLVTIIQPTCGITSGSVQLSGLPVNDQWIITMTPGGSITGTGADYTIADLTSGNYTFMVTNASGCTSSPTSKVTISLAPAIPTAPIVGAITQPTKKTTTGSVVLNGLPAKGQWILTMSPGGMITTGTGKSKSISKLAAGSYTWTVTNASGCISGSSANVIIKPFLASIVGNSLAGEVQRSITSSDNNIQDTEISVYPNPVSSQLNIRYSNDDFTKINILNSSGILIRKEKVISPLQQLDFSGLQPNLYILEFISPSGKLIRVKILKK